MPSGHPAALSCSGSCGGSCSPLVDVTELDDSRISSLSAAGLPAGVLCGSSMEMRDRRCKLCGTVTPAPSLLPHQFSCVIKWFLGQLSASVIADADDTFSEWSGWASFLPLICEVMRWASEAMSAHPAQPHCTKGKDE